MIRIKANLLDITKNLWLELMNLVKVGD